MDNVGWETKNSYYTDVRTRLKEYRNEVKKQNKIESIVKSMGDQGISIDDLVKEMGRGNCDFLEIDEK